MVKRMLGITTMILLNSIAHSAPYPHSHSQAAKKRAQQQQNSCPQPKKKNNLTSSAHTKEPDVETIHSNTVKKN